MDQVPEDRTEHPTYVREQRHVASLVIALLVKAGTPPEEALRKAVDMITYKPRRDRSSGNAA